MIFPAFISYLAKTTLISAIFFAYYLLFLRDSPRHVYNRCYLLGTTLLALLIPLLRLPLPASWAETVTHFPLQPGQAAPDPINAAKTGPPPTGWREPGLLSLYYSVAYAGVVLLFFWPLFRSLRYLSMLSRHSISEQMPGFRLYQTLEPGTPFSFFHHLFWNEAIPLDTPKGQAILQHELVHIRQKHSMDILFLEMVRALGWCNPFLHLQLRELKLVHEYLADDYALQSIAPQADHSARAAYAEWLVLQAAGTAHSPALHFYSSPLQKRITMILQTSRPRGPLRQLVALPLIIILCCAFAHGPDHRSIKPDKAMMRFFNRHLRYPPAALHKGLEETVSFFFRIGEHNQLLEFKSPDADQPTANSGIITVTARARAKTETVSPGEDKKADFVEEVQGVTTKISLDTTAVYKPGDYSFTIKFRIEEPAQ
jgi:hypothetical protein